MLPSIAPPQADELAALLEKHAHRFPAPATIGPLLAGRGKGVTLPIVVANPPPGSAVWNQSIAAALSFRPRVANDEELVKECLLWPPRARWVEWRARWAGVDARAVKALSQKMGGRLADLVVPEDGVELPEGMALGETGVGRILKPYGAAAPIHIIVDPPDDVAWRLFVAAAGQDDADVEQLCLDTAEGCVKASTMPFPEIVRRWPGMLVGIIGVVAELAGTNAEVKLGNW